MKPDWGRVFLLAAVLAVGLAIILTFPIRPRKPPIFLDFYQAEAMLVATNSVRLPPPIHTSKDSLQWTVLVVTNASGATITVTPPPGCRMVGDWTVSNWSAFYFQSKPLVGFGVPIF